MIDGWMMDDDRSVAARLCGGLTPGFLSGGCDYRGINHRK